jgi:hypothetical protein
MAKHNGTATQLTIFTGLLGTTPSATFSAPTKMKKFDQFFRFMFAPLNYIVSVKR